MIQSNSTTEERMLQSVLISQYRRKVAEKFKIALKPVIMMKSKTIKESQDNHLKFIKLINELKVEELKSIEKVADGIFENDNILKNGYSSGYDYKEFYDQDLADYVYSYLEEDFVYFNYNKDSWKNGTP